MRLFIIYSFSFLLSSSLAIFNLPLKLFKGVAQCKNPIHSNVIETISDNSMLFFVNDEFDTVVRLFFANFLSSSKDTREKKKEKVFFFPIAVCFSQHRTFVKVMKIIDIEIFLFFSLKRRKRSCKSRSKIYGNRPLFLSFDVNVSSIT